jgi:hypothetical protein
MMPVTAAAKPNHMKKMPGAVSSSTNKIAARIIQFHAPSAMIVSMGSPRVR